VTTRYEKECVFNKLKPRHLCNTAVDCTDSLDPPRLDRAQVQNWPNYAFVKPGTGQVARPCTWLLVVRNMMRPSEPRQLSTTSCVSVTDPTPLSGREVSGWSPSCQCVVVRRRRGDLTTRVVVWTVEPQKTRVGDGQTATVYLRAGEHRGGDHSQVRFVITTRVNESDRWSKAKLSRARPWSRTH
jgi:hypothetical protein